MGLYIANCDSLHSTPVGPILLYYKKADTKLFFEAIGHRLDSAREY